MVQRLNHRLGCGEAVGWLFGQRSQDDEFDGFRKVRGEVPGRAGILVDVLQGQTERRFVLERETASDHLVEDHPQRVNV
jgi:hypothetical protein